MVAIFDLRQARAAEVRKWLALFQHEGNKAAAWRCYRLARAWGLPVPELILGELDRIATAIGDEVELTRADRVNSDRPEKRRPGLGSDRVGQFVTEAHRGSADPAAALISWERDFEVAWAVNILIGDGAKEWEAVERVAAGTTDLAYGVRVEKDTVRFGPVPTPALSVDVVRRAVRRVKALATDMTETADLTPMNGASDGVRD